MSIDVIYKTFVKRTLISKEFVNMCFFEVAHEEVRVYNGTFRAHGDAGYLEEVFWIEYKIV